MPDDFGLKIGIEGERGFKNAIAEINRGMKLLGSGMRLAPFLRSWLEGVH